MRHMWGDVLWSIDATRPIISLSIVCITSRPKYFTERNLRFAPMRTPRPVSAHDWSHILFEWLGVIGFSLCLEENFNQKEIDYPSPISHWFEEVESDPEKKETSDQKERYEGERMAHKEFFGVSVGWVPPCASILHINLTVSHAQSCGTGVEECISFIQSLYIYTPQHLLIVNSKLLHLWIGIENGQKDEQEIIMRGEDKKLAGDCWTVIRLYISLYVLGVMKD